MLARSLGPIRLRCQSAWEERDVFHEYALALAAKINAMAGGDLSMEILPLGSVVRAAGLLDSVSKGALDGGHCMLWHHYEKDSAFGLWGSGPAFGMDANQLLAWHQYGGGKALLEKLHAKIGANVVSFLYGPMPTQPLGWFKKPVRNPAQFKGLRYRTVGMSVELFEAMGAEVRRVPDDALVAAMRGGQLDGAEHRNASSDRALGLPEVSQVCMLRSYHQSAEQFELLLNKDKFAALPAKLKAIVETAVLAASQDTLWKAFDRYSTDYAEMMDQAKVRFFSTPPAVLQRQLRSYDAIARKRSADPLFEEIQASQRRFAKRVVGWDLATNVDRGMAYKHYFRKLGAKKK